MEPPAPPLVCHGHCPTNTVSDTEIACCCCRCPHRPAEGAAHRGIHLSEAHRLPRLSRGPRAPLRQPPIKVAPRGRRQQSLVRNRRPLQHGVPGSPLTPSRSRRWSPAERRQGATAGAGYTCFTSSTSCEQRCSTTHVRELHPSTVIHPVTTASEAQLSYSHGVIPHSTRRGTKERETDAANWRCIV